MSIHARKILFLILSFLFFIIGGVLIAYSFGTRFNFESWSFSETGGIYIKSEPSDINIYLDNESIKNKSGFLRSGTLIDNLSPGIYSLALEKEGYSKWQKNVIVESSLVSIFDNIILISLQNQELVSNIEAVDDFYIRGGWLIFEKEGEVISEENKIAGNKVEDFNEGGLVVTYNEQNGIFYLSDISNLESSLNINVLFNNLKESRLGLPGTVPVVKVRFHPFNQEKLIIQSQGALYILDALRLTINQIHLSVKDFSVGGNEIVFYDNGAIYQYNLILRSKTKVADIKEEELVSKMELDSAGRLVILKGNGELQIREGGKLTTVAYKAEFYSSSYDGRFIAFKDYDGSFFVYRIDKEKYLQLETQVAAGIENLVWYKDNAHLFIQAGNKIYFVEIDEYQPINVVTLSEEATAYEYNKNYLYFSTPKGIFRIKIE